MIPRHVRESEARVTKNRAIAMIGKASRMETLRQDYIDNIRSAIGSVFGFQNELQGDLPDLLAALKDGPHMVGDYGVHIEDCKRLITLASDALDKANTAYLEWDDLANPPSNTSVSFGLDAGGNSY